MRKRNSLLVDEANDTVTAGKLVQAREGPQSHLPERAKGWLKCAA